MKKQMTSQQAPRKMISHQTSDGVKFATILKYVMLLPVEERAVEAIKFTVEWQKFKEACEWACRWCEKYGSKPENDEQFKELYARFEKNIIEPLEKRFKRLKNVFEVK